MRSGYVCLRTDDVLPVIAGRNFNNLAALSLRLTSAVLFFSFFSAASLFGANISGVWANEGGDKVTQDELRATNHTENRTGKVINRAWDGTTIHLSGAHNEEVSFDLVLEAAYASASNVSA